MFTILSCCKERKQFLEKVICEPEAISLQIDFTAFIILTEAFYGTVHSNNMLLSFSGTGINIYIQTLYSEVVLQFKIHMPLKYTGEFFTHFETEIQQFSNLLPDVQVFTVYFIVT